MNNNHPADLAGEIGGAFACLWAGIELQTQTGEFGVLVVLVGIVGAFFVVSAIGTVVAMFDDEEEATE